MAKNLTWDDFNADDSLLNDDELDNQEELEEEEEGSEEEEPGDDEKPLNKKKEKKITKKIKEEISKKGKVKVEEVEEEEEEEEEIDEVPDPKKKELEAEEEEEEEEEETQEIDPLEFFDRVSKITGQPVEVDYKGIDPSSVEGFAAREKAIREQTLDTFLTEIEEKFPMVFKALQHANNGGDIADLFKATAGRDYTKVDLKDGDEATAKEILKEYYRSKGVKNEARIAKMIESDEDSDAGLIAEARTALAEMAEEQASERDKVLEQQKTKKADQDKKDSILTGAIDDVLDNRKLGTFRIIDRSEANQFRQFVISNITRTGEGKYAFTVPIDQANIEKQLQYQYFQFKQGDLSKMVQQKAATENANKLKLRVMGEQSKGKKSSDTDGQKINLSFKDFTS